MYACCNYRTILTFQLWFSVVWTLGFRRWQSKDLPQPVVAVIPPANPPSGG
jgi:hypothetical protein